VPLYIKGIAEGASRVFLALCHREEVLLIAQKLNKDETYIRHLVDEIMIVLTRKGKLSLLDLPVEVFLSELGQEEGDEAKPVQADLLSNDLDPFDQVRQLEVREQFVKLSPVEQLVLECMVIGDYSGKEMLQALREVNISIKEGVIADDLNIQDVYYFLKKTLKKIKLNMLAGH